MGGKKVFKGLVFMAIAAHLRLQAAVDSAHMRLSYKSFF